MKLPVAAAIAAATLGAGTARADEVAETRASIAIEERAYYAFERNTAYTFVGVGIVSAGAGAFLVTRSGDFARGAGWSVLSLGVLQAIGAGAYKFQVDALDERYAATLARDPAAYKREEGAHIAGTTSRFVFYRATELGLALAGIAVATYGFVKDRDLWKGIGTGVAIEAITFLTIDSFGTARAHRYQEHVERFRPEVTLDLGGGGPWGASVRGRF